MPIFTEEQLARMVRLKSGDRGMRGVLNELKLSSRADSTTSVFLSHCHEDKNSVEQVAAFLRTLNASVYIDWMDTAMPENTTGVTAIAIKDRILRSDKFIFLATNASVASKWCNWEIGFGDAQKLKNDKFCLFPLADSRGRWEGNEYLQIYPYVETVDGYDRIFYLTYPSGVKVWFDEWLRKA